MTQPDAKRPFIVGLMGLLMYLQALVSIAFGVLLVLARNNDSVLGSTDIESGTALVLGIVLILVGLLLFLVARGLRHGSRAARNLVAFSELLGIAGAVYAIVTHAAGTSVAAGVGTIVGALVVLWILFGHEASKRFFSA